MGILIDTARSISMDKESINHNQNYLYDEFVIGNPFYLILFSWSKRNKIPRGYPFSRIGINTGIVINIMFPKIIHTVHVPILLKRKSEIPSTK